MLIEAVNLHIILRSLPAWGVRVEIIPPSVRAVAQYGHSPHGECGLKFDGKRDVNAHHRGHSPHGECGLKFTQQEIDYISADVTPRMGSAG